MAITAGIGSDHVDLQAAMDNKIDVVEVTFCNSRSVAEHIVMMIVSMVRITITNTVVNEGGWNIADAVPRSYDVEGMHIGTVAAGRELDALRKMKPLMFICIILIDTNLQSVEKGLNLTFHESVRSMVKFVM